MNEVATYIRCQINGKWTNLGLIAEEGEIQEHFEFVEGLLKEKQRADELEKRWSELKEWLDEQSSECMTKYRKSYNERDDEKSETYNEIFNKMMTIEKENDE